MKRVKADYTYQLFRDEKKLAITDLNLGSMSVTNCIEDVVTEIEDKEKIYANDYLIIYRDSEKIWDGWDNKIQSFVGLNQRDIEQAFLILKMFKSVN